MTAILVVCGRRNSGKTSWVCALANALLARDIKVGTVKHTHHRHDVEGKDTDRHQRAGVDRVMLISREGSALYRSWTDEPSLADIAAKSFSEYDLVLAEGFRSSAHDKIIVGDDPDANLEALLKRVPPAIDGVVDDVALRETEAAVIEWLARDLV